MRMLRGSGTSDIPAIWEDKIILDSLPWAQKNIAKPNCFSILMILPWAQKYIVFLQPTAKLVMYENE